MTESGAEPPPQEPRSWLESAVGPAFVIEERDLTSDGLTGPDYVERERDDGPGKIVVILPAHNEALLIGEALESLAAQTRLADEVIVIADRCTDSTIEISFANEVAVQVTFENLEKKAGALNQVLATVLPRLSDNDAVLVMDADGSLSPRFLSEAALRLREPEGGEPRIGAVGGIFLAYPLDGFLAHMQNNEWVRYAREIGRRKGRADVLTGTATLFSVRALRDVEQARKDGRLNPGEGLYDVEALTEDNELTLALKHLGYRCVSPKDCMVGTEVMPTAARLFHQRLRWQRGALENLRAYGLTRVTAPYIGRQLMIYAGVAFVPFFFTTLVFTLITTGTLGWSWFWIFVTGFVVFERAWSVKRGGWKSIGLAALVVPEVVYDLALHSVYVKALTDSVANARETWDHTKIAEFDRSLSWWHRWSRIAGAVYTMLLLALVVCLALLCAVFGLAWFVIAVLVLAGAGLAALRLSGLDPMGMVLSTGELAALDPMSRTKPQGFGGRDVTVDPQPRGRSSRR